MSGSILFLTRVNSRFTSLKGHPRASTMYPRFWAEFLAVWSKYYGELREFPDKSSNFGLLYGRVYVFHCHWLTTSLFFHRKDKIDDIQLGHAHFTCLVLGDYPEWCWAVVSTRLKYLGYQTQEILHLSSKASPASESPSESPSKVRLSYACIALS